MTSRLWLSGCKYDTFMIFVMILGYVNECLYPDLHDCSVYAWCINTNGSYLCYCKEEFQDTSPRLLEEPGKICSVRKEPPSLRESCSEGNCDTRWGYVVLCLIILGVLLLLTVIEIIMKRREIAAENNKYMLQADK
ncbi:transmembrane cell adhesion receptor mua-3 [Octopus bimaculoides]|uniref:transmembrane cell adhesion receptor mua-3 n=1 Tax=Octopus bimaculoides TaxID=37653 RepID=UPI00071C4F8D|nr:transmembrane cell adhesion receptor mua-3 [Octopus bimaculoides]|eukprot:XP_014769229.1 PREDICTED: transmembrane cell adhesion receptor mua-3-like [Octopus bimaculoides]